MRNCLRTFTAEHAVALFFVALLAFVALTYQSHGISNDEIVQNIYGQLLLKFYGSGLVDDSAFHYKNLYLYGGLFDLIAAALEPLTSLWVWDLRHLISAGFGVLGFWALYRIACLMADAKLGLLALSLLALTSLWTSTMFTHTKDIPFATCMLWALYATILVVRDLDRTAWRDLCLLGLAVGAALGLRIGGAFAVIYLILLLAMRFTHLYLQGEPAIVKRLQITILKLFVSGLLAFVVMAFCWPWSVTAPDHILEAVKAFSYFAFHMETILHGHVYKIGDIPNTYLFEYLLVKLPEVVLLGIVAFVGFVFVDPALSQRDKKQTKALDTRAIAFVCVLVSLAVPLLFVLYDKPALYNGVRHFTFVVPLLILLAAWGLMKTYQSLSKPWLQALLLGVAVGLSTVTLRDIIALHPYDYMRLNRLVSEEPNAQYQWEGDYWSSALREVSSSLTSLNLPKQDKPYLVSVCAESPQGQAYLDDRFKVTKDWDASDFFMAGTNMHCHQVMKGKVIGAVYRDGLLLAVVKDRRALRGKDRWGVPAKN